MVHFRGVIDRPRHLLAVRPRHAAPFGSRARAFGSERSHRDRRGAARVLQAASRSTISMGLPSTRSGLPSGSVSGCAAGCRSRSSRSPMPRASKGFVVEQAAQALGARSSECFHWATPQGAELDLLVVRGNRRIGVEVKCTEAPQVTKSMEFAMKDLGLDKLWVVHQGRDRFTMRPGIEALPIAELTSLAGALGRCLRTVRALIQKPLRPGQGP